MPAGVRPVRSDAPVGQAKKGVAESVNQIIFARASKWHSEVSNTVTVGTLTNASQILNLPIASYGYLSAVIISVSATGGSTSGAVFFEDGPWSVLQQVQLSDVNGVPIFQMSGFHAFLAAKYGGYRLFPADGVVNPYSAAANRTQFASSIFSCPAPGVSNQTSNFFFILPIFLEFGQDGLGCLPNMDASARYNLQLTIAPGASVNSTTGPLYTTGPSTFPSVAITVEVLCRSQPPAQDMFGNINSVAPPSVGTVQYWTTQTASGLALGQNTIQFTRVGNLIRNQILVWRNSNGTRTSAESTGPGAADVPQLFELDWDAGQRYVNNVTTLRWFNGYGVYGIDTYPGVLQMPNTLDPEKLAGSEYGDEWLGTVGATKLTARFTNAVGGGSLSILTNDIVPASAQVYKAAAYSSM
jgi:hypothetical protein